MISIIILIKNVLILSKYLGIESIGFCIFVCSIIEYYKLYERFEIRYCISFRV